jgi:hypothetical protein
MAVGREARGEGREGGLGKYLGVWVLGDVCVWGGGVCC